MKKTTVLTSLCTASILFSGYLFANHHGETVKPHAAHNSTAGMTQKEAISISRSGSFELDMTPEKALPLFTAPGEVLWAPGWNPTILRGDGFEADSVFTTYHDEQVTYWHVAVYDKKSKHARYTRVTPNSDIGTVDVRLSSNGNHGSVVKVTYKLTSLTPFGDKVLTQHFDEASYANMMIEWQEHIINNMDKINAAH